jgi:hypothetical protein
MNSDKVCFVGIIGEQRVKLFKIKKVLGGRDGKELINST